jgi:hypothetical protein
VTTIQEPEEENRKDELTQLLNRRGIRALAELSIRHQTERTECL